jgi:acetoin utilization deacetylase AcuC-like enzyme
MDPGIGFCLIGNVAIAVNRARVLGAAERVRIFDWDVHHVNETQSTFVDNERILVVSLHQEELYPENSGLLNETGEGTGVGYTMNVPLPAGAGDTGYPKHSSG